jgi:hypothetical protein
VLAAAQAQLLLRMQLLMLVQLLLLLALHQRFPSHLTHPTAACQRHHQHMLSQQQRCQLQQHQRHLLRVSLGLHCQQRQRQLQQQPLLLFWLQALPAPWLLDRAAAAGVTCAAGL